MNKYLSQLNSKRTSSLFGDDDLESDLIIGSLTDLQDEADILSFEPKLEGQQLKNAQSEILRRLQDLNTRAQKVACPFRRKKITEKIRDIKGHGSLNQGEISNVKKVGFTTLIAGGGVLLTAMGYQAYLTRDIENKSEVMEHQYLGKMYDDPSTGEPYFARPKLTHLLQEHKVFYAVEFAIIASLYGVALKREEQK